MSNLITATDKNIYKFALFGIKSSGKTCILSVLALPRVSNPKGFTCTWIEHVPGHEISTNSAETINAEDPFVVGAKWLKESKELLKKGDLPAPTEITNIMRFLFEFSSKENGSISVELIDYSGELLVTRADTATKLKQIMRDCDGLLVLAEVPKPDSESGDLAYGLDDLSKAFATLAKERESGPKQEWPIALLFNKWDRRLDGKEAVTNIGQEAIDNFLSESPEPPHKSLVDKITNLIGNENIRCFPISAFGSHDITQDGKEVPKNQGQMLKTINLEDGFIWLAERSDTLKVKMLLEASKKTSWWMTHQLMFGASPDFNVAQSSAIKNWFCGISARKGMDAAWDISHKLPAESEIKEKANKILRIFRLKALAQLASFILMIILSAEFLEIGYDGVKYREISARREHPATDGKILVKDEEWLTSYYASPNYRHFLSRIWVLTKNQAKTKANEWANKRDEFAWMKVISAKDNKDEPNEFKFAKEYLFDFPTGKHSSEAEEIIVIVITREMRQKNKDYLDNLKIKINTVTVDESASVKTISDLLDDIYKLPHPTYAYEDDFNKQRELRELAVMKQKATTILIAMVTLEKFKQEYYSLIRNENVLEAASLLKSRMESDIEMLKIDFRYKAPEIIVKRATKDLNDQLYDAARKKINETQDVNVSELLTLAQIKSIKMMDAKINIAEDKDLYEQFKKYMSTKSIDNYLEKAPLKTMKKEVDGYKAYLGKLMGEVEVNLDCNRIFWDKNYGGNIYNYRSNFKVFVNGKEIISKTNINSTPGAETGGGSGKVKINLNNDVNIEVKVDSVYGKLWDSSGPKCGGIFKGKYSELQSSITMELKTPDNSFVNKNTLILDGIPMAPSLPDWKEN
jgi:hypothetical protein